MKTKEIYSYEILIVDESGKAEITCEKSLLMAISYSDKLWNNAVLKPSSIEDKSLEIVLQSQKISSSDENAFIITLKSGSFDKIENFRLQLLSHLKNKLGFSTIKVLSDGISSKIALEIYPLIAEAENALRVFIAKYHLKNTGIQWWKSVASSATIKKINSRNKSQTPLSQLVDMDISLADFEDLTELSSTCISDSNFKSKWSELSSIRDQVLHNDFLTNKDFTATKKTVNELLKFLSQNEQKVNSLKTSTVKSTGTKKAEPKKSILKKAINKTTKKATPKKTQEIQPEPSKLEKVTEAVVEEIDNKPKVEVAETTPQEKPKTNDSFKMITEEDLLKELRLAESSSNSFIDLKAFVNDVLVPKGYASGPTFSLARMMSGKGLVDIYDTKDETGMPIKAVKVQ